MKDDGIGLEFFKVLMNAVDQFLLAGHTDSSQHASSHLAELNLDQIQPRAMLGREHEDEALWHGLPGSFALLWRYARNGCLTPNGSAGALGRSCPVFEEGDKISAGVRVAHRFDDSPGV
jgi:hypothetical protein